ncbi:hypothetical protein [Natronomonas marina]|uniref:hypothetical protein n=1 Tax=Natronomonas marina TaxID=2961939 RepID=UPI0020C9A0B1|nr:hypothetical protein [Natronomonas marina]
MAAEDAIDHLGESERAVTALVFAFVGSLAHEVYETVPFVLLDSGEAIDDEIEPAVAPVNGERPSKTGVVRTAPRLAPPSVSSDCSRWRC